MSNRYPLQSAWPFYQIALTITFSLGALWGAWILWDIGVQYSFTSADIFRINAHGHAQMLGWIGLLTLGYLYSQLPRKQGSKPPYRFLSLLTLGLFMHAWGLTFHDTSLSLLITTLGSLFEGFAVLRLSYPLFRFFFDSPKHPSHPFIFTGLSFLILLTLGEFLHAQAMIQATSRELLLHQIQTWQPPLRDLEIHGFLLFTLVGISLKILPQSLGVCEISPRRASRIFWLLILVLTSEILFYLAYKYLKAHAWAAGLLLPWMLLLTVTVMLTSTWKLWSQGVNASAFTRHVRVAYGWLLISNLMLLFMPIYNNCFYMGFSHAWYGAIRHAITVGFASTLLIALGQTLSDGCLNKRFQGYSHIGLALITLGCSWRVSMQILSDWHPLGFTLIAISGLIEMAAFLVWGWSLASLTKLKAES